jgi:hypothetical protein
MHRPGIEPGAGRINWGLEDLDWQRPILPLNHQCLMVSIETCVISMLYFPRQLDVDRSASTSRRAHHLPRDEWVWVVLPEHDISVRRPVKRMLAYTSATKRNTTTCLGFLASTLLRCDRHAWLYLLHSMEATKFVWCPRSRSIRYHDFGWDQWFVACRLLSLVDLASSYWVGWVQPSWTGVVSLKHMYKWYGITRTPLWHQVPYDFVDHTSETW